MRTLSIDIDILRPTIWAAGYHRNMSATATAQPPRTRP
jgi:hypothetical protein